MKNRLENIINLKLNNFEIKPPVAKGDKPVDVQEAEVAKKLGNPQGDFWMNDFADYPWEDCIADQIKAYGSEEIAKKVCGKIKAENASKVEMIEPNPCWEGYEAIGTKIVDGKEVPNCVPIKENQSKVVKEGFPVPSPEGNESESDFMGRCMHAIGKEYPQDQAVAICISKWQEK